MDCSSLADVVDRFINSRRHEASPAAVVDVAMGMMRLAEGERRAAIVELCRSLAEHAAGALPAHLVVVAVEKLDSGPVLDAATLAVTLCGADGARQRFPMSDTGAPG